MEELELGEIVKWGKFEKVDIKEKGNNKIRNLFV